MNSNTAPLDDQRLMDAAELGKLIGRSTKSVKIDSSRRPETLPPRFQIPGTRKLAWRVADVRAWMEALADIMAQKRVAAAAFAKKVGFKSTETARPFHLGERHRGAEATEKAKS
jgi:predicted DNA-binding transcriptional regulator AlpA